MYRIIVFLLCGPVFFSANTYGVSESFQNLIKRIPETANTIVLVNVDSIHSSNLAKTEKWRERHEKLYSSGLMILPPQSSKFVLASQMDLEFMQPSWQTALMDLKYEPNMPVIASKMKGEVDKIAGQDAVYLPIDAYVVKFGPRLTGVMAPGIRQDVSRWVNRIYSGSLRPLSSYLQEAISFSEKGIALMVALDLENMISTQFVKDRLDSLKTLEGKEEVDKDALTKALASIRGISLGVTFTDKTYGSIKVDFNEDISVFKDFAKPLLLEILAKKGALINEFYDWEQVKAENGKQVRLRGELYSSGRQRIMSLFDAPPALQVEEGAETTGEIGEKNLMKLASQQYFQSVTTLLKDLRTRPEKYPNAGFAMVAIWFEKYARKIGNLPLLNVDPELLDYGAFVSASLHKGEMALKGIGSRSGYRMTLLPNYFRTYTGYSPVGVTRRGIWGIYWYYSVEDPAAKGQAEARIRMQERIEGAHNTRLIMQGVEQETSLIRRKMTEKYKAEFRLE